MTPNGTYRWVLLTVYLVVSSAPLLVQFSLGVMLPDISNDLSLSDAQQGLLGAVGWIGTLLLYIPLSVWLARYSPVLVTTTTTAFGVGAILMQVYGQGFGWALAGRFLLVLPIIAQGPARTAIVQQWFRESEVATVNGLTIAAIGVVELISYWGSPPLISLLGGWREVLFVYAAVTGISAILWALIAREHPTHDLAAANEAQGSVAALRSSLRRADVRWLVLAGLGSAITWSSFFTFWPTYAVDTLGLNLDTAGFIWGLGSASLTFIAFIAGAIAARFRRRKPLILASFILNVPTFLLMLSTDNVPLLALFSLLMGASWFFIPILNTIPFELPKIQPREVAMVWALFMVSSNLGTSFGPLFTGILAEFTPDLTFPLAFANVFLLISIVGILFVPETGPTREKAAEATPQQGGASAA